MFSVIKYNSDTGLLTVRDEIDGTEEEVESTILDKLEKIGLHNKGYSNGKVDSTVEVVENPKITDIFKNLSEEEVNNKYAELKAEGLSDDDIFTELYSLDCNRDDEEDYDDYDEEDYDDYDDLDDDEYEEDEEEEEEYEDFDEEDFYPEDEESEDEFEDFYSRYDEDNARFYSHLNKEQGNAFRAFSRWYTKVAFSSANSLRLKLATQKGYKAKKTKQLIQLSGTDDWEFDGMEVGIRQGDFECSLGHKLKNCYYAINQTKLRNTGETEYIQFGIVCVKDFFDLDENAIKGLNKATNFLMASKEELCEIYDNNRESEVGVTLEPLKKLVSKLRQDGKQQWVYDTDYQLLEVYDRIVNSGMLLPKPLVYRICNNLAKTPLKEWIEYLVPDYDFAIYKKYCRGTVWESEVNQSSLLDTKYWSSILDELSLFIRFYFTVKLCGDEYSYNPRYPIPDDMSEGSAAYALDMNGNHILSDDTKFGKNVYTPKDKAFIMPYAVEKGGVSEKVRKERYDYLYKIKTTYMKNIISKGVDELQRLLKVHNENMKYCVRIYEFLEKNSSTEADYLRKMDRVQTVVGRVYSASGFERSIHSSNFLKKVDKVEKVLNGDGLKAAEEDIASLVDIKEEENEERWQELLSGSMYNYDTVKEIYNDLAHFVLDKGKDVEDSVLGVYESERHRNFKYLTIFFARDLGGLGKVPDWMKEARDWYLSRDFYSSQATLSYELVDKALDSVRELWCKNNGYTSLQEGLQDKKNKLEEAEKKQEELVKLRAQRNEELNKIAKVTNNTYQLSDIKGLQDKLNDIMQNWEVDKPDKYYEYLNADKLAEDITQSVLSSGKASEKQLKHILKALYAVDDEIHIILPEKVISSENSKYSLEDKPQIKEDVDWYIENNYKDEWKKIIDDELGDERNKLLAICYSIKKWNTVSTKQANWIDKIRTLRETHENK